MKVLVLGNGGREHAIASKFNDSKLVSQVYITNGNSITDKVAKSVTLNLSNIDEIITFVKQKNIDLTFVGGETLLLEGIVNRFNNEGLNIFGPTKNAAQIEGSKEFAKKLMKKYNIPTADYEVFSDYDEAINYIESKGVPIVIKYDGLAAGKGVVVALSIEQAKEALNDMLLNKKYGNDNVIIEECLEGPEYSLICLVNEDKLYPLDIAQDYKRAFDNDEGGNTGGMGAISPVSCISKDIVKQSIDTIMYPTINAMIAENVPFTGVLYAGLILTSDGPKVIEFNARFGDPETEVLLHRLKNDFYDVISNVQKKENITLDFIEDTVIGVVMASNGYPNSYDKGFEVSGYDTLNKDFYSMGLIDKNNKVITNGGRVLIALGKGKDTKLAQEDVYEKIKNIKCSNLFYRKDIGKNA